MNENGTFDRMTLKNTCEASNERPTQTCFKGGSRGGGPASMNTEYFIRRALMPETHMALTKAEY